MDTIMHITQEKTEENLMNKLRYFPHLFLRWARWDATKDMSVSDTVIFFPTCTKLLFTVGNTFQFFDKNMLQV